MATRLRDSINLEIDAALREVETMPKPGLDDVFDNVYADPPKRVTDERDSMRPFADV